MKKNLPVSGQENNYPENVHLVSTTDRKGTIVSANQDFIEICGFDETELVQKSHNIVRHPDMPPAAFDDLWKVVKQGKPWMGIVKNRCKNGDHYWVDAYVTPTFDGNEITGYQSVRITPDRTHVSRAEHLYKQLNEGSTTLRQRISQIFSVGLAAKIFIGYFLALIPALVFLLANPIDKKSLISSAIIAILGGVISSTLIARPWQQAARNSKSIFSNTVAQHVYTGRHDELGQLQLVIKAQQAKIDTIVWRIDEAAAKLDNVASRTSAVVEKTNKSIQQQQSEIEQVATAITQMSSTVHEVARNAAETAESTRQADEQVNLGKSVVNQTITSISRLAKQVGHASDVIAQLNEDSEKIGSVIDVIRGIAEQTNLLALNAAIEAARAGEQGRGFAVVADEVRTLANRTQSSTDDIQKMIQGLQHAAVQAADVMKQGQLISTKAVEQAKNTGDNLDILTKEVSNINDRSFQIATAAEQQSTVSEEVNRNMENISLITDQTINASEENERVTQHLLKQARGLRSMVKQFTEH
ncbi:MAG: PAS domain-containing protein [Gammaproteobacteria bacterium]|nr:PAS domain-containing protein [Gammaproteobacteria bacterium]